MDDDTGNDPEGAILEELSRDECVRLLGASSVGRIAVPIPDGSPLVVPVNYVLDDDVVVFRTDPGAKLAGLRQHSVSFQVDSIDPFRKIGWSVLVSGIADEASPEEVGHLTVEPWATGPKQHWIRVLPREITGRRLRLPEIKRDSRGYL